MTYAEILIALFVATLLFIGGLVWFRTKRNGDYTVIKVAIGVGLTIAAQWVIGGGMGLSFHDLLAILLWPFVVSGGAIIAWQATEYGRRLWERYERRLRKAETRLERDER